MTIAAVRSFDDSTLAEAEPVHVHALGLDPGDGSLFIATHTGLFRLSHDQETPERVSVGNAPAAFLATGAQSLYVATHTGTAAVFIDDSSANVEAAKALGFCAIKFTDATALRRELTRRGLLADCPRLGRVQDDDSQSAARAAA